jgi:hypothetical protein
VMNISRFSRPFVSAAKQRHVLQDLDGICEPYLGGAAYRCIPPPG